MEKGCLIGSMTVCVITQTRPLLRVKGSIRNSYAGEQASSTGDGAEGMQSSEDAEVLQSAAVI